MSAASPPIEQRLYPSPSPSPSPSPDEAAAVAAASTATLVLALLDRAEADTGVDLGTIVCAATAAQRIAARQYIDRGGNAGHLSVAIMAGQVFADKVERDSRTGRVPVGTVLSEMAEVRS